ncbi:GNAT family N-acetyltransferase, partial [Candidatus Woesearchaeota archaeon]|nr:GNAT family N-acetyltransferase [Candidatus Woesearchaeota archaeon]
MEVIKRSLDELNIIEQIEKKISLSSNVTMKRKYLERLKKRDYSVFFAVDEGEEVGYAVSYGNEGKFYIWTIAVLEKYREKGVAKDLLQRSIDA